MKNLYKVLNIFALAAVIALMGGCFSQWEGDGATITIHVGGGSGRTTAFHLLDDEAKARISYMLDLSGPSNMTDVQFAPGTQTINLSVTPGSYTITVTAYLDGEVYATGSTTAEARAGQSTPVDILMSYAGEKGTSEETFTVTFDSNGGDGDVPQSIQVNAGGNIALPDGDGLSKDGYVFGGWSDDRDGTEESYHAGYPYPVTASITLYAVWVEVDLAVHVNSISIDKSTLNLIVGGETETLTATVNPDNATNKAITWSSGNTAVATVSNGTITAVAAGNTTITVTTADGGFTAQCEVAVSVSVTGVTLDESTLNLIVGETETLTATVNPDDATNKALIWSSDNTAVVTVSSSGLVTPVKSGTATITVTTVDGGFTALCEVTVYPADMVRILAGTFMMGSPATEKDRQGIETQHEVTLTKGFYMGKYEVTQEQYQAVIGSSNPSNFQTAVEGETGTPGKLPVEKVSWYDALVFCNKLSMMEGLDPVYSISGKTDPAEWGETVPTSSDATWNAVVMDKSKNGYRLPTEAEWEYACRAGMTTAYNTGASIDTNTGWYKNNSSDKTHQVGLKLANAWGLHDMHGNVSEWCWDRYNGNHPSGAQTDPTGGASGGSTRVVRDGNWSYVGSHLRSAYRFDYAPSTRVNLNGFRLVRSE
jgi:uncharacterized repeat protein (TIGR02543 family)